MGGFIRERSCVVSMLLFYLPIYTVAVVVMGGLIWGLCELGGSSSNFFSVLLLGMLCAYSFAVVCAVWCTSSKQANRIYVFVSSLMLAVCGYLRYENTLPPLLSPITTTAYSSYLYQGLMITVFKSLGEC